ncbi:caspase family protein [Amycolatopsis mediterranei]|uniref:caspase family protein n=1 Tax=Amycolatopsis mediterranei TaxID=33910 RepID=UPI00344524BF
MSASVELADHARADGTYLMTASAETSVALAPRGEPYTAFTGSLVDKLLHGLPDGPDVLEMSTLYHHVRADMQARHFPVPQQRTRNDGKAIALVRNRHRLSPRTASATADEAVRRLPQPPIGTEALMRRRPADMYAEVQAFRAHGQEMIGAQLLAASAALRPDQEVAAIIALLRQQGIAADVGTVLASAAKRPPEEILRIVDALHDTDLSDLAIKLLRTAADGGRHADTAGLARMLQAAQREDELVELLNAALGAAQGNEPLIDLVNALWVAGLRDEVDRLIVRAASNLPGPAIAVLADELREVGREEVAFGLYAASSGAVVARPRAAMANLCKAMTEAGRDADSAQVAQSLINRAQDTDSLLEVTTIFWETEQETHAERTLAAAADQLSTGNVLVLAAALRQRGHDQAAFSLCSRVAAVRPAGALLEISTALREEGRPVDARRLIDETTEKATPSTVAELLGGSDAGDRQRILRTAVGRGAEFCAGLLATLTPADPVLAHRFTDLITDAIATQPELITVIVEHLEPSAKEQIFAGLVNGDDLRATVDAVRSLPPADARTLVFVAVRAGRPTLAGVFEALSKDGSPPEQLLGQPVERLGPLVRGLRTAFPAYAEAILDEAAAAQRGDRAIADDIVFLFGSDEPHVGEALLRTALTGRSSTALKSIIAALREHDRPEPLVAAAQWVRETYEWMGSNGNGILRQLGLREYTERKSRLSRRHS